MKAIRDHKTAIAIAVLAKFKKLPDIKNVTEIDTRAYTNGREQGLGIVVFFARIDRTVKNHIFQASWAENRSSDDLVVYAGWTDMMWEHGVPSDAAYAEKKYYSIDGKGGEKRAAEKAAQALHDLISAAAQAADRGYVKALGKAADYPVGV